VKRILITLFALILVACEASDPSVPWHSIPAGTAGAAGAAGSIGSAGSFGFFTDDVVVADPSPPPTSGGTLIAIAQGHKAAVSDPDLDQVLIVDLDQLVVTATIPLQKGDEPGRLVEDGAGLVHVALRGAGALVTIDPVAPSLVARQNVCTYPRGLAYDARNDSIYLACAGGELITLPSKGGEATRRLRFDRDLRDVVIDGDRLLVTRFRSAELLVIAPDGTISSRLQPPVLPPGVDELRSFAPAVAWRMVPAPGGGALISYQEEQISEVPIQQPGGYEGIFDGGSRCGGSIVRSAVAWVKPEALVWSAHNTIGALPVDLAMAPDGTRVVVVSAGAAFIASNIGAAAVQAVDIPIPTSDAGAPGLNVCSNGTDALNSVIAEQVVAVAFDARGRTVLQTRQPSGLVVEGNLLRLPGPSSADTGHKIFHLETLGGIACASCHPEGREDGHVWTFTNLGKRRTQPLGGGVLATAPFHWMGEMANFDVLAHEVFNNRMSGPVLQPVHVQALANWVNTIPAWKPFASADAATIDRGRAVFTSPAIGCVTCHSGPHMTNNANVNVGTSEAFQVPSLLGVGWRAPFMHDGCAPTLEDRFGPCGGGEAHGHVSALTPAQRTDLISYLLSL